MNVARLVASVAGYFYSTGSDTLAVHLYGGSSATLAVAGASVRVRETSNYPWSGDIRVTIDPDKPAEFTLRLRIPGWARNASARVNGTPVDVAAGTRKGYLEIRRKWAAGDTVELELPMPAERIYANPNVRQDAGRVALKRGPLVYCIEQIDNPETPVEFVRLPRGAELSARERAELFDGIVSLEARGSVASPGGWDDTLYRNEPPQEALATLTAIPYYLWSNRQPGRMLVWIPEAQDQH